jgi:hypothetical protein
MAFCPGIGSRTSPSTVQVSPSAPRDSGCAEPARQDQHRTARTQVPWASRARARPFEGGLRQRSRVRRDRSARRPCHRAKPFRPFLKTPEAPELAQQRARRSSPLKPISAVVRRQERLDSDEERTVSRYHATPNAFHIRPNSLPRRRARVPPRRRCPARPSPGPRPAGCASSADGRRSRLRSPRRGARVADVRRR